MMRLASSLVLAVLLALTAPIARAESAGAAALPDGFVLQPIASGVESPSGFAFLPDGRVLVTEQKRPAPEDSLGFVRLVVGGNVTPPVLTIPNVATAGNEQGLLGIAVDPEWPARPYVYVHFTSDASLNVVRRYTGSGDLSAPGSMNLTLSEPYDVLADLPGQIEFHNGGTVRFGPDGMLYVSHGDDATDTCTDLQDPDVWKGVILRLDVSGLPAGPGGPPAKADLVPAGNPFPGPGDNARLTYAVGLRNPFRFTIDPVTGALYVGDVGESSWEELNEAAGGENFGWPLREGAHDFPPGAGCGDPGVDPIAEYAHGTGPAAIIAGPRYRDDATAFAFGAAYDGDVFYHGFYDGWIRRLSWNGASWEAASPAPGQPNADDWATGLGFMSDLQQGPDGAIYYVRRFADDFFGRIAREPVTAVDPDAASSPSLGVAVTPRPLRAGRTATIAWQLDVAERVTIGVYDVSGRRVRTLTDRGYGPGTHEIRWETHALTPGVYFVRVTSSRHSDVTRVPIVR